MGWLAFPRAQEGLAAGEEVGRGWEVGKTDFSRERPEVPSPASEREHLPQGPGEQVSAHLRATQRKFQESWLSSWQYKS